MSTYCKNTLTISHDDPKFIKRIVAAYQREKLFDEFIPCPKELDQHPSPIEMIARRLSRTYGTECWCTWRTLNWGTTRDTGHGDGNMLKSISSTTIKLNILTEHEPPVHVFDLWVDLGCDVRGSFLEEGERRRVMYRNKPIWIWNEEKQARVEIDRIKLAKEIERTSADPYLLSMIKPQYRIRTQHRITDAT